MKLKVFFKGFPSAFLTEQGVFFRKHKLFLSAHNNRIISENQK